MTWLRGHGGAAIEDDASWRSPEGKRDAAAHARPFRPHSRARRGAVQSGQRVEGQGPGNDTDAADVANSVSLLFA